jgi:hypothetical protein
MGCPNRRGGVSLRLCGLRKFSRLGRGLKTIPEAAESIMRMRLGKNDYSAAPLGGAFFFVRSKDVVKTLRAFAQKRRTLLSYSRASEETSLGLRYGQKSGDGDCPYHEPYL